MHVSSGFEPTIPVFEQAKMIHVLDRAATVIGSNSNTSIVNCTYCEEINLTFMCITSTHVHLSPVCCLAFL
jgi:hypothetical protein